jgi:hypothetical protein
MRLDGWLRSQSEAVFSLSAECFFGTRRIFRLNFPAASQSSVFFPLWLHNIEYVNKRRRISQVEFSLSPDTISRTGSCQLSGVQPVVA